jgi:gas vesicle protein
MEKTNMTQKGNPIGTLFIGILIGGLVGTGVALLAAPQTGEQTRTMLRERGVDLRNRASSTVQDTRVKAEDVITKVRSRAEELTGRFSSRREEALDQSEMVAD